jgi:hypothetical protein
MVAIGHPGGAPDHGSRTEVSASHDAIAKRDPSISGSIGPGDAPRHLAGAAHRRDLRQIWRSAQPLSGRSPSWTSLGPRQSTDRWSVGCVGPPRLDRAARH